MIILCLQYSFPRPRQNYYDRQTHWALAAAKIDEDDVRRATMATTTIGRQRQRWMRSVENVDSVRILPDTDAID